MDLSVTISHSLIDVPRNHEQTFFTLRELAVLVRYYAKVQNFREITSRRTVLVQSVQNGLSTFWFGR
jgi:hypothetical protein